MQVKIEKSIPRGEVVAPPSKSLSHRALICGALGNGAIENLAFSDDIKATINCLKTLGAYCKIGENNARIGGFDPFDVGYNLILDCGESASTLRFLFPLCLLSGKKITLKGSKRLFQRPLEVYEKLCNEQGIFFEKNEDSITICGCLSNGNYKISGDVSSQFVSGLLFTLPLLSGISIIEIEGELESAPYVGLTLNMLSNCGIKITVAGNRFIIMGNQEYKPFVYTVEGDFSNAAVLDAFNYIGGEVKVKGLPLQTYQGDKAYKEIFDSLENGTKIFDLTHCPDLAPISMALAALKGGAEFRGIARLRLKESDRVSSMTEELEKFGVESEIGDNFIKILKSEVKAPIQPLNSHNDHRIAMALSLLCSQTGGIIENAEAVNKSYPDFFKALKSLNINLEEI